MIVKMSKVEIAGPKDILKEVLSTLQEAGMLHIEPTSAGFIEKKDESYINSFLPDENTLKERLFLDEIKARIEELFTYLPAAEIKTRFMEPRPIIDTISETLQKHLISCRELFRKKKDLEKERAELNRYTSFLDTIEPLIERLKDTPDIDYIGLSVRDEDAVSQMKRVLKKQTDDNFELITSGAKDGTVTALIAVSREFSDKIRGVLTERDIPEMKLPSSFGNLPFIEKLSALRKKISEILFEIEGINMRLDSFLIKWGPVYRRVKEWAEESLSVLRASASVFETEMCFLIYGWMASENIEKLKTLLNKEFRGKVLLEGLEISEHDLERVPVVLKNPEYFRPFEIFTRMLPLPQYSSFDPTPFIAIFFPVFFGLILGDAGYGLLIIAVSLIIFITKRKNGIVIDISKILILSALYAVVFGILFGEFFGDLGHRIFSMKPILVERRTAVIPMLYFAIAVGVVHLGIGSLLGFTAALRKKTKKEALSRLIQILLMLGILSLLASLFGLFPALLTRPIILTILLLTPVLLFTGGLLAPLELIKGIGNIISYARIMAIGLTSVLLAFVANKVAGITGDIVTGIFAAGLLHLINIIIGIFSPAIHSLRLHYVEFFSKFIESGGRKFSPLKKKGG